jgi:hypothetical protein
MLLGDADIRFQARHALADVPGVTIVGELAGFAPRHLTFIEQLQPETVVLDCGAAAFNPFDVLSGLTRAAYRPRVIAVDSTGCSRRAELLGLGVATVVRTHEELRAALLPKIRPLAPITPIRQAA